jgi:hypothetical protein
MTDFAYCVWFLKEMVNEYPITNVQQGMINWGHSSFDVPYWIFDIQSACPTLEIDLDVPRCTIGFEIH